MYQKAYGIIETLAPLHVGASAGEEAGNLNLIFRDQFTQTGIIPGSSIRGRFRADMRSSNSDRQIGNKLANSWYGHSSKLDQDEIEAKSETDDLKSETESKNSQKDHTTESLVKFEYASLVWFPVFCPGQPIVWVTCPRLLKRYKQIAGLSQAVPKTRDDNNQLLPYPAKLSGGQNRLFFNLGYLENLELTPSLSEWIPPASTISPNNLVVVDDNDIGIIHEMGLYRQTRTKLNDHVKKVENFFGFEALPEESILVFPIAVREDISKQEGDIDQKQIWKPFKDSLSKQLYFGGLESIGCGRCQVTLNGKYFQDLKG